MGIAFSGRAADTEEPDATEHWAYQAIRKTGVPTDKNPVDHFIHKSLEKAGVSQNPPADRHTFLRRVTLDLTGLPPTREEIAAFVSDKSEDAHGAVIDRLLASPHYGERWGRHWLDVARYVQGTIKVPGVDRIDLAEPYRDYVVKAFNEDKPYDRFIAEQLAGDLIGESGESTDAYFDRITAPAFLSIGQWFEECTDPNKLRLDIIDEQISTTTRAFLALDFACMRCHDGKFDPVSIQDYYALAGIFRSTKIIREFSTDWKDGRQRQLISLADKAEAGKAAGLGARHIQLREERGKWLEGMKTRIGLREKFELPGPVDNQLLAWEAEDFAGHKNLRIRSAGATTFIETRKGLDQWVKYRIVLEEPGDYTLLVRYASGSPVKLELDGEILPDTILGEPTFGTSPDHLRWQPVPLRNLDSGSLHIRFLVDRNERFPVLDCFRLVRGIIREDDTEWRRQIGEPTLSELRYYLSEEESKQLAEWDEKVLQARTAIPRLDQTLRVSDESEPINLPVHIGGDVYRTEPLEMRRAVPSLAGASLKEANAVPEDQSGRVQLARWLTNPDHPLTARVMVNRIWHWHFGVGLVRTTDDFGRQGAPPTHPELLDWLAAEFINSGWSIKHIHRLILTSATYRASSEETPANLDLDADGTLLSRFPKRRLEVEAIYDSMLTSIGKVPRQDAGSPLDNSKSKDRALYILTSSRSPMGLGIEIRKMFPLFGFDPSGRPMHDRDESITPKQSLWWLNNPLPKYYAGKLAEKLLGEYSSAKERALAAHEIILGRPPGKKAERAFLGYLDQLDDDGVPENEAWSRACLALFSTRSFQTLD